MHLEEVRQIFEENGEFILKTLQFEYGRLSDKFSRSKQNVYTVFQEQFISLLKAPTSIDDISGPQFFYKLPGRVLHKKTECEIAEGYFSDLLYPETFGKVPADIATHLQDCSNCAGRFIEFTKNLSKSLNDEDRDHVRMMTAQLVGHFQLLGTDVNCRTVRQFLPFITNPLTTVEIPTPVTAHIDQCLQCFLDSVHLKKIGLDQGQLSILSQLYSEQIFAESDECPQARSHIHSFARFDFEQIPGAILKHICLCKSCRKQVLDERIIVILKKLSEHICIAQISQSFGTCAEFYKIIRGRRCCC